MSSRKPKSALDRERYTAELSTGQLVIGVCILLMFGLGCFLLGVLIGKFDPTLRDQVAGSTPGAGGTGTDENVPPIEQTTSEPIWPVNNALPPEIRPPRTLDQPPTDAGTVSVSPPPQAGTTAEQPRETRSETPGQTDPDAAPQAQLEPGSAQTSTPAEPPPSSSGTTGSASAPKQGAETSPAPAPAPAEAPPAEAKPPVQAPRGNYGVQIIAVARPRAEAVKRDVEARSTYNAQIVPIDGNRLCKVIVGAFPDERSALQARDEMRTKYSFRDAFVVSLR